MKKLSTLILGVAAFSASAQIQFDPEITWDFKSEDSIVLPPSPLKLQVLFVGGVDRVQTTATYGNAAGSTYAKQWHDFIGLTEGENPGEYYVSVNHEMVVSNDSIGDGGGMTVFKVARDPQNDTLMIVEQTLLDGRRGKFFNVDFANTVGETGMNCGGIVSMADGRIWTAEEWWRNSNKDLADRDTADFVIGEGTAVNKVSGGFDTYNGSTIKKYQNYNYMTEIDPRQAKAIRKQYNWGRQPFEGGVVLPDNKTVYLGSDNTPGHFSKFVADVPGDFNKGKLYVYKHDAPGKNWVEMPMDNMDQVISFMDSANNKGATMFNRVEWVTADKNTGMVYFTETGRDKPANSWKDDASKGGVYAPHHLARAATQGTTVDASDYWDYYGRVLKYDPIKDTVTVHLEGGPYEATSPDLETYKTKYGAKGKHHLSNPDGLSFLYVGNKSYLLVQEDINGASFGRAPLGFSEVPCELFLLDASIENPTLEDLVRVTHAPWGAEITGAIGTSDGKSILVNSQHPLTTNKFPFNNSLTFAITGFDQVPLSNLSAPKFEGDAFQVYPNPTSRILFMNKVVDAALYDLTGKRVKVYRGVDQIDVAEFTPGTYILVLEDGTTKKVIIQ
jgi:secreted PhoX family phosphatase